MKLALRRRVPIVPVVGHGGHESLFVLTRGEGIAKRLGVDRIRLGALPLIWQLPWGVSLPIPFYLPLPTKITVQVCEPIRFDAYGPEAADDPELVQQCYDEVLHVMRETLEALVEEVPYPLLSGLRSWLPGIALAPAAQAHVAGAVTAGGQVEDEAGGCLAGDADAAAVHAALVMRGAQRGEVRRVVAPAR